MSCLKESTSKQNGISRPEKTTSESPGTSQTELSAMAPGSGEKREAERVQISVTHGLCSDRTVPGGGAMGRHQLPARLRGAPPAASAA
jgi:hypothetical protein